MFATMLRPDYRRPSPDDEVEASCRRCGAHLYVLPEDRRLGYCFDCYDPSEARADLY